MSGKNRPLLLAKGVYHVNIWINLYVWYITWIICTPGYNSWSEIISLKILSAILKNKNTKQTQNKNPQTNKNKTKQYKCLQWEYVIYINTCKHNRAEGNINLASGIYRNWNNQVFLPYINKRHELGWFRNVFNFTSITWNVHALGSKVISFPTNYNAENTNCANCWWSLEKTRISSSWQTMVVIDPSVTSSCPTWISTLVTPETYIWIIMQWYIW